MQKHIFEECPKTLHPCRYASIGCDEKVTLSKK